MQAVDVLKGTVYHSISDGVAATLMGYDGLGMAPSHDISDSGPMQHGETFRARRLDARVFQLVLGIGAATRPALEAKRGVLYGLIRPRGGLITVRFTTDAGAYRCIDCQCSGGLDMGIQATDPVFIRQGVVLRAPDPTFYDPIGVTVTFGLGGGAGSGTVPMAIPMSVGASTVDQTTVVTNAGTWMAYPLIRITGPITDPVIENTTTGDTLDFTGITIAAGHYYDIDCRYGQKTVLLDGVTNKVADLTAGSDLATFNIAADPEVLDGRNSIRVTGSAASTATQVEVTFLTRYVGI